MKSSRKILFRLAALGAPLLMSLALGAAPSQAAGASSFIGIYLYHTTATIKNEVILGPSHRAVWGFICSPHLRRAPSS